MIDQLLSVITTDDPRVPSRICSLLAQRGHHIDNLQMSRGLGDGGWTIFLAVRCQDPVELELLIKRLNRLIDVIKVTVVGVAEHHRRRSLFIRLQPSTNEISHLGEIARLYSAEVLELTPTSATVHISASSARCLEFLALIQAFSVIDITWGAVSGLRTEWSPAGPPAHQRERDRQKCLR